MMVTQPFKENTMYKDIESVILMNTEDGSNVIRITNVGNSVVIDSYDVENDTYQVPCVEFEFDVEDLELMLKMVK